MVCPGVGTIAGIAAGVAIGLSLIHIYIPVILWATTDMKAPYNGRKIPYGDGYIQWIAPEHCLLLVGYDDNNYIFHDPQEHAYTYYGKDDVTRAYLGLGAQCVVITPYQSCLLYTSRCV